ncbi:ribosome recycling factor [Pseudonocardia sp. MCCB 268]|nr:ribosome recycling factor [Pseudonocardia cytotoxica]
MVVDYYGSATPLELATVRLHPGGADGGHQAVRRQPAKAMEKAIAESDLGVNPSNDGQIIRVIIPALSEERCRGLHGQGRPQV